MVCKVISSVDLVSQLKTQVKDKVLFIQEKLNITPKLVIILTGNNPASLSYVKSKINLAKECGMKSEIITLNDLNSKDYDSIVQRLNNDESVNGFMLQLPALESVLKSSKLINENTYGINIDKDVDCLEGITYKNMLNKDSFIPCTPLGVLRYLSFLNVEVKNSNISMIGLGRLVGMPLADILEQQGADVTRCDSSTKDLNASIANSDTIICAVGKHGLLNSGNVKSNQVIIDVGINKVDGKIVGDCDATVFSTAKVATPVPGGVGPLTVMSLITNTVDAAYMQNNLTRPTWEIK